VGLGVGVGVGVLFSIEVTATLLCNSVAHLWRAFILTRTPTLTLSLTR